MTAKKPFNSAAHKTPEELGQALLEELGRDVFDFNFNLHKVFSLIEAGASLTLRDAQGCTGLILAAQNRHNSCLEVLFKAGAKIDDQDHGGSTALHWAASCDGDDDGAVKLLVDLGANIQLKDAKGMTALMQAAEMGLLPSVKVLIEAGARIDEEDAEGLTAIQYASKGMPPAGRPEREDYTQIISLLADAAEAEIRADEEARVQALHDTAVTNQDKLKKRAKPVKIVAPD